MLLVEEICHLATSMKMIAIAEGIERQEQADALRDVGCEYGQGYLFSRPLSVEDCEGLLAAGQESFSQYLCQPVGDCSRRTNGRELWPQGRLS